MKHVLKQTVYYTFETDADNEKTVMEDFKKALEESAGGYFAIEGLEQVGKSDMQLVSLQQEEKQEPLHRIVGYIEDCQYLRRSFEFRVEGNKYWYILTDSQPNPEYFINIIKVAHTKHLLVGIDFKTSSDTVGIEIVNIDVTEQQEE